MENTFEECFPALSIRQENIHVDIFSVWATLLDCEITEMYLRGDLELTLKFSLILNFYKKRILKV